MATGGRNMHRRPNQFTALRLQKSLGSQTLAFILLPCPKNWAVSGLRAFRNQEPEKSRSLTIRIIPAEAEAEAGSSSPAVVDGESASDLEGPGSESSRFGDRIKQSCVRQV